MWEVTEVKTAKVHVARYRPYYAELVKGQTYYWCRCGLSRNQPFCDASHKGTEFQPVRYVAAEDEEVLFCGCKHTKDQPFCDGSHNNLRDVYEQDDPFTKTNLKVPLAENNKDGLVQLNGHCYAVDIEQVSCQQQGNLSWNCLIAESTGAKHQSQYYFVISQGESPIVSFDQSGVIILVTAGEGTITIAGKDFQVSPNMGVYVRPGESFRISNKHNSAIKLYVSVYPQVKEPVFPDYMSDNFDNIWPQRTIGIDPDDRQSMADRFFQILVDKKMGSAMTTQFIGEIPESKAAMHRHLYEESIVILKGQGFIWTENTKAAVKSGDVIFLPCKQSHSLECTDPGGMMLAGVICPGDNPAISY